MNLDRLRGPLVAAISTLLLAGGSVALATDPSSLPQGTSSTAEEPGTAGADLDNIEFEDESGADDAAEGAEAEAEGPDTDDVQDESGAEDESGARD